MFVIQESGFRKWASSMKEVFDETLEVFLCSRFE
jgi:hypothetical protein|tara:strand:- start:4354 stop:4455 length:102 start_codon:yes stop_codon:yes gene_type:complete